MKKVMRIGTILPEYGSTRASVYITCETDRKYFSLTGVVGPTHGGNSRGGCGQIAMEFQHQNPEHDDPRCSNLIAPDDIHFAKGWDAQKWLKLLEVWHDWHLKNLPDIPKDVIEFIESLPNTDKSPGGHRWHAQ